jgi:hypothetical protein
MDNKKNVKSTQKNDSMLTAKTNEDFNKQKPNPNVPKQTKKHQIGENEETEKQKSPIVVQTPVAVNTVGKGNTKKTIKPIQ